jgi:HSP20 family protein
MLPIQFRTFNSLFENDFLDMFDRPLAHYYDDVGDSYEMRLEVPGVKKENTQISVQKDTIKVVTTRKFGEREDKKSKILSIPQNVDLNKADALIEDGILTLRLPKREAPAPKLIPIR